MGERPEPSSRKALRDRLEEAEPRPYIHPGDGVPAPFCEGIGTTVSPEASKRGSGRRCACHRGGCRVRRTECMSKGDHDV